MENQLIKTWCFNGLEFTNFVSFVKLFFSVDLSKSSKSILLKVENDKLVCRAISSLSSSIEYTIDLFNINDKDNLIDDQIVVSIDTLLPLVKCPNDKHKFIIRKCAGQFEFNIIGNGWIPFKVADSKLFRFNDETDSTPIGEVSSTRLYHAISAIIPYIADCTYARDKYIQFSDNKAIATSRLSCVIVNDEFINMTLHRSDALALKLLLKNNVNNVKVNHFTDNGLEKIKFSGDKFNYTIPLAESVQTNYDYMSNITDYIAVNFDELCKLTALAIEYKESKNFIGISIKNNQFRFSIKNHLASHHTSYIKSSIFGNNIENDLDEVVISTNSLLKALKIFQDSHPDSINFCITSKLLNDNSSIIMFNNKIQVILNVHDR